jgi:tetratricopeptide (TPR) repeat protein
MGLNRFDEAKIVLKQAQAQKLETTNMHARLFQIAIIQGDAAGMKGELDWADAAKADDSQMWQAQAAEFSGQLTKANQFNDRAIGLARRNDFKETIAQLLLQQAIRNATFGNCGSVAGLTHQALELSREQAKLVAAANVLAACGQAGAAQPLIDDLAKRFPQDTLVNTISIPVMRAQLELSRGNAAQAIQLLEPARRYDVAGEFWPQYLRGQAYLKLGNGAQAAAEFQNIIDHRGWYPLSPLYALAHLGVAREATLNSDAARARQEYQNFFTIWKDADPSIPILVAAHQEYEKVK